METTNEDYYKLLGVDQNASHDEIKRAYKLLAVKYHPDKVTANNSDMMTRLNEAKSILLNEHKRKEYDLSLPAKQEDCSLYSNYFNYNSTKFDNAESEQPQSKRRAYCHVCHDTRYIEISVPGTMDLIKKNVPCPNCAD